MKKKEEEKNHFMGKITGYRLIDGVYHISPMYSEHYEKITAKRLLSKGYWMP